MSNQSNQNQLNQSLTWTDSQGREWNFRLTIADLKRLKSAGTDIADPDVYKTLFGDTLGLIETVAEVLRPQWESRALSYEQFAECLIETPDSLVAVQAAFVAGLSDFFRRAQSLERAVIVEKAWAATKATKLAIERRANSQELQGLIDAALAKEEENFREAIAIETAKISGERLTNAQG